jgi:hypothetical protein
VQFRLASSSIFSLFCAKCASYVDSNRAGGGARVSARARFRIHFVTDPIVVELNAVMRSALFDHVALSGTSWTWPIRFGRWVTTSF